MRALLRYGMHSLDQKQDLFRYLARNIETEQYLIEVYEQKAELVDYFE